MAIAEFDYDDVRRCCCVCCHLTLAQATKLYNYRDQKGIHTMRSVSQVRHTTGSTQGPTMANIAPVLHGAGSAVLHLDRAF